MSLINGNPVYKNTTVYFPPGVYIITKTLLLGNRPTPCCTASQPALALGVKFIQTRLIIVH